MEFLGTIIDRPTKNKRSHFKWNYVELIYKTDKEFNESTGKFMKAYNEDGKIAVSDTEGIGYIIDFVHANFDVNENLIKILPFDVKKSTN